MLCLYTTLVFSFLSTFVNTDSWLTVIHWPLWYWTASVHGLIFIPTLMRSGDIILNVHCPIGVGVLYVNMDHQWLMFISLSSSSWAQKAEKLTGSQLRVRKLTRHAVWVLLKSGMVTSRTSWSLGPERKGRRRKNGILERRETNVNISWIFCPSGVRYKWCLSLCKFQSVSNTGADKLSVQPAVFAQHVWYIFFHQWWCIQLCYEVSVACDDLELSERAKRKACSEAAKWQ